VYIYIYIYRERERERERESVFLNLLVELHELWCKPQEPIQSSRRELPGEQEANICGISSVLALAPTPQPLQSLNGHIRSQKLSRVWPTL
jgi:hypothetical protein